MPPPRPSVLSLLLLVAVLLPPAAAAKHRHASTSSPTAALPASYLRVSWASNLTLLGSASLLPGATAVALTTPTHDGVGAGRALFSEPVRLLVPSSAAPASFSTRFTFRITPAPTYGDGLAFLLTSSRTFLGASNGFLGLFPSSASDEGEADLRGVTTVAVEFDTHRDVALRDPDGNHVSFDAGSIFSVASASPGVDLRAGVPITAWVEYRAPRRRLSVWLSYSPFRRPVKPALSADTDLSGLLRTFMYAGFSASNGNGAALHVIERWTFSTFGFANSSHALPPSEPPAPPNKPLLPHNKPPLLTGNHQHHHHRNLFYKVLGGVLGGVVVLVFVIGGSVVWLSRPIHRPSEERMVPSEEKPYGTMSMEVVRAATKGFDSGNVIGVGGSGATVYEGVLQSGSRVAVKRFQAIWPCTKAFVSELAAMLNCPNHPNLVRLAGWCCSKDELVLVYEFMPNGNLDCALHTMGGATLPWEARFRAVLGIASALEYLHDGCDHRILHRDVKSSNVLLDGEFNARLGDFGLARLVSHGGLPHTTQPAGTLGYLAPEYVHSGVATERSDVYSFGVLALEVATGRRPTERGISVVDWVWVLWSRRRLVDAADQRLQGRFVAEEMRRVLLVGLSCVHPDCRKRPGMRRVVKMLDGSAPLTLVPDKKPPIMLQTPAETKASPNTTVPSVQMLAVQVKLGTRIEARMLPSFLRCFPNVETLYVQSGNDDIKFLGFQSTGTGKINLKFWKEAGPIECVQRHIKKVVLREFRGMRSELDFLKFIAEQAKVLEKMVIVLTNGHSPSDAIGTNLKTKMASANWANACCELMILQSPFHQEGTAWCYLAAFDLSNPDPFDVSKCVDGKCLSHKCVVPVSTCKSLLHTLGNVSFQD